MKLVAVVPHYRHITTLPQVIAALKQHGLPVMVVDDGSGESFQSTLQQICAQENVQLFALPSNGGKGHAMKYGMQEAAAQGFSHVLQIDADAQHCFTDIPELIRLSAATPAATVCGRPIYGNDAPKARLYGRKITDFWNVVHTWSFHIKDGMCGFRIYPLAESCGIIRDSHIGDRMDFDNEILIHLYWRNVPIIWHDTPVCYQADGISHFRAWKDNLMISKMHTRLFFKMLKWRLGLKP
ncbi:glycosyltransferase family 2 protein [Neisseria lisongii]|uniref:Glycosyltransferase family 2 protein n=1 Tax=Neisseria lisongii TaxID=2912188 RepID=A0AAW5ADU8_9NEIS|nr:glycosyltransferase family 2 protein [Neisseria lisongii]MCF7529245.1 glycosyltransferase family 2 protein [Neisseria lisongii]